MSNKPGIFRSFVMLIGILIMVLSGTCTFMGLMGTLRGPGIKLDGLLLVLGFGLPPLGIGYLLYYLAKGKD